MTEMVNIAVSSEDKKLFEEFSGMKINAGMKLLMDNIKYGGNLGFDPFWSEENQKHLRQVAEDAKYGRNMHVHELIEME